jgi:hypothetical protein
MGKAHKTVFEEKGHFLLKKLKAVKGQNKKSNCYERGCGVESKMGRKSVGFFMTPGCVSELGLTNLGPIEFNLKHEYIKWYCNTLFF